MLRAPFLRPVLIALWSAFLFLPFKGLRAAAVLFVVLVVAIPSFKIMTGYLAPLLKKY